MKTIGILLFLMLMTTQIVSAQQPAIELGVSQTLARWRAAHYSNVRYKLDLKIEKMAPLLKGTIEVRVDLTEEGAKNNLILDWRTTQFQNDKDKPFARVTAVNGTAVTASNESLYSIVDEHLQIGREALKTGENVVVIEFASPIKTSGAAVTRYVDKTDGAEYIYSLFVPSDASTAFPVFDQPDLKARFTLKLRTPVEWRQVSNARPTTCNATDPGAPVTCVYEETKPISTYVFAFAAGEFAAIESEPPAVADGSTSATKGAKTELKPPATAGGSDLASTIYVRKSQAEKFKQHAAEVFRLNREGVKFLESYFDYKFPFPKYDLVLIPEFPFGGMEHAGATFLREASIIFPSEPTKNDFISRANLIFHEAAHQWFGDTVTMKWFDDLWLKEGFAEFTAYKTLEKVMPEYNAWKAFYERNKPLAYLTDSTKGTTPIYQEIPNLSSAKSAYGNIVYRKAPAFLRQAEFYLGEDKFQTAVRAFLKKHEFKNAEWKDLVTEFETASKRELQAWGEFWVKQPGLPTVRLSRKEFGDAVSYGFCASQFDSFGLDRNWNLRVKILESFDNGQTSVDEYDISGRFSSTGKVVKPLNKFFPTSEFCIQRSHENRKTNFIFPNYQDYGYGIFLLDPTSREYVLKNIQTEKDDFLRSMMWGTLWDSVREGELDPRAYVELAIKNINIEQDESTIQAILGRVGTALNYYVMSEPPAVAGGLTSASNRSNSKLKPPATAGGSDLVRRLETVLAERVSNAKTSGQRITFYRAYLNLSSSATAQKNLKDILLGRSKLAVFELRTKDKFDIVTRLIGLGDADAPQLLATLEKTETSDDAKRYAYAARAAIATEENKAKYFKDFMTNKEISESWIEAAFGAFNSPRHSELTLKYLETALAELPNLKRNRKIFFVNGWLGSFIGGQKSPEALEVVNKFLESNPNLDKDLRLKILENADNLERAVKISSKY